MTQTGLLDDRYGIGHGREALIREALWIVWLPDRRMDVLCHTRSDFSGVAVYMIVRRTKLVISLLIMHGMPAPMT